MSSNIALNNKLTCFSKLSTDYCEQKKGKITTLHEAIQNDRENIYKCFSSQPFFKEIMPLIDKDKKSTFYYKKMVSFWKKTKSGFFGGLLKAIRKVSEDSSILHVKRVKPKRNYSLPQLELLKKKKIKCEKYFEHKTDNSNKRNNSNLNNNSRTFTTLRGENFKKKVNLKYNNSMLNLSSSKTNNIYPNCSMQNNTFITGNKKSQSTKSNTNKINFRFLIDKCEENLSFANEASDSVYIQKHNNKKETDSIKQKIMEDLKNKDQKMIEEKEKDKKNKYKKLEEQKFQELKRKMRLIISESYAYKNRKELHDFLVDNESIKEFDLYKKEMKKILTRIGFRKIRDEKNINLIEDLLDGVKRDKEFLKMKINDYSIKNKKINELCEYHDEDFHYMINNNEDKNEIVGTLLPKLLSKKDQCYWSQKNDVNKGKKI